MCQPISLTPLLFCSCPFYYLILNLFFFKLSNSYLPLLVGFWILPWLFCPYLLPTLLTIHPLIVRPRPNSKASFVFLYITNQKDIHIYSEKMVAVCLVSRTGRQLQRYDNMGRRQVVGLVRVLFIFLLILSHGFSKKLLSASHIFTVSTN